MPDKVSPASDLELWLDVGSNFQRVALSTIRSIFRCTVRSLRCWSSFKVHVSHPYSTVEETTASNNFKRSLSRNLLQVSSSLCFVKAPQAAAIRLLSSQSFGSWKLTFRPSHFVVPDGWSTLNLSSSNRDVFGELSRPDICSICEDYGFLIVGL